MLTKDTSRHTLTTTVVMPAYNTSRYIAEAVESVLAQTRGDFELFVVDDGSTDETAAVVARYLARDSRIRLISQSNQGIGAARNTAIAAARTPWVALLDSDDYWFPTYLAEQLAILEARPDVDVLSANALNVGGPLDGRPYKEGFRAPGLVELSLLDLIRQEDAVCILSVIRKEMFDRLGGFDATLRGSEDYDLWLRAASSGYRIAFNPKALGGYRRRADSVSADELRMLDAIVIPLERVRQAYASDAAIGREVKRQLARFAERRHVVVARQALLRGDVDELAGRFDALHRTTGRWQYRVGRWICGATPAAIPWLYRCKSAGQRHLGRMRRYVRALFGRRPQPVE
jgi:cellulose synthase/poly-beta-1,6-N-acetylglucosamine synthase-like glycosyltransferase